MGLIGRIKAALEPPELPVRDDILQREREFTKTDSMRVKWINSHTYLSSGDLEALKKHPEFNDPTIDYRISYYAVPNGKRGHCKPVVVSLKQGANDAQILIMLEEMLKLELHIRGCNAGVFYSTYQGKGMMYAKAVPAILTGE